MNYVEKRKISSAECISLYNSIISIWNAFINSNDTQGQSLARSRMVHSVPSIEQRTIFNILKETDIKKEQDGSINISRPFQLVARRTKYEDSEIFHIYIDDNIPSKEFISFSFNGVFEDTTPINVIMINKDDFTFNRTPDEISSTTFPAIFRLFKFVYDRLLNYSDDLANVLANTFICKVYGFQKDNKINKYFIKGNDINFCKRMIECMNNNGIINNISHAQSIIIDYFNYHESEITLNPLNNYNIQEEINHE